MRCPRIGGGSGGSPVPSSSWRRRAGLRAGALGGELGRQLGIGVVEHAEGIGRCGRLEGRDAARDILVDRLVESRLEEVFFSR